MQAQNSSERKKSKKGRQYPAPPTGSKATRLGITKKFINFLLDHDVTSLGAFDSWKPEERYRYDEQPNRNIEQFHVAQKLRLVDWQNLFNRLSFHSTHPSKLTGKKRRQQRVRHFFSVPSVSSCSKFPCCENYLRGIRACSQSPMCEAEGGSRLHNTITDWPDSGYTRRIPLIPGAPRPWPSFLGTSLSWFSDWTCDWLSIPSSWNSADK